MGTQSRSPSVSAGRLVSAPPSVVEAWASVMGHREDEKTRKLTHQQNSHFREAMQLAPLNGALCITQHLDSIPAEAFELERLRCIRIVSTKHSSLPDKFTTEKHSKLQEISFAHNKLTSIPESIGVASSSLQILALNDNFLETLPDCVGEFAVLQQISLHNNCLKQLPSNIGNLQYITKLNLDANKLSSLPASIASMISLQILSLDHNCFETLPICISLIPNLERVSVSANKLVSFPTHVASVPKLRVLDLGSNQISVLPKEIGRMTNLERLILSYNCITTIPGEMGSLEKLVILELDGNPLQHPLLQFYLTDGIAGIRTWAKFEYAYAARMKAKAVVIALQDVLQVVFTDALLPEPSIWDEVPYNVEGAVCHFSVVDWAQLAEHWGSVRSFCMENNIATQGPYKPFAKQPKKLSLDAELRKAATQPNEFAIVVRVMRSIKQYQRPHKRETASAAAGAQLASPETYNPVPAPSAEHPPLESAAELSEECAFWDMPLTTIKTIVSSYVDSCGPIFIDNISLPAKYAGDITPPSTQRLAALRIGLDTTASRRSKLFDQWREEGEYHAAQKAERLARGSLREFRVRSVIASKAVAKALEDEKKLRKDLFDGAVVGSMRYRLSNIHHKYNTRRLQEAERYQHKVIVMVDDMIDLKEKVATAETERDAMNPGSVMHAEMERTILQYQDQLRTIDNYFLGTPLQDALQSITVEEQRAVELVMVEVRVKQLQYRPLHGWQMPWYAFTLGSVHKAIVAERTRDIEEEYVAEKMKKASDLANEIYTRMHSLIARWEGAQMKKMFLGWKSVMDGKKLLNAYKGPKKAP